MNPCVGSVRFDDITQQLLQPLLDAFDAVCHDSLVATKFRVARQAQAHMWYECEKGQEAGRYMLQGCRTELQKVLDISATSIYFQLNRRSP